MFKFTWWKRWIRSRSRPIPMDSAELWQKRLSLIYFFCAWNILAFVGYHHYKLSDQGIKISKDETTAEMMIRRGQLQNATVYKVNNLSFDSKKVLSFEEPTENKDLSEPSNEELIE